MSKYVVFQPAMSLSGRNLIAGGAWEGAEFKTRQQNLRSDTIDPAVTDRKIAIDIDIHRVDSAWLFSKLGSTLGVRERGCPFIEPHR